MDRKEKGEVKIESNGKNGNFFKPCTELAKVGSEVLHAAEGKVFVAVGVFLVFVFVCLYFVIFSFSQSLCLRIVKCWYGSLFRLYLLSPSFAFFVFVSLFFLCFDLCFFFPRSVHWFILRSWCRFAFFSLLLSRLVCPDSWLNLSSTSVKVKFGAYTVAALCGGAHLRHVGSWNTLWRERTITSSFISYIFLFSFYLSWFPPFLAAS